MSSPPLTSAVASAAAALGQALRALTGLAEALGRPETVKEALAEAKAALAEAEAAREGLEAALVAALAAAAATTTTTTTGLDAQGLYQALGAAADASASELERELRRNSQRRWILRVVRTIAVVLMLLCAPLLSLDAVRATLGVTQENHLVPCLATLALACQVALLATATSKSHLMAAAGRQRHQALRYRRLARADAARATEATETAQVVATANINLETLEEVTSHLRNLVAAVTQDLEVTQGFPAAARALGDAVVALGTTLREGVRAVGATPGEGVVAVGATPGDEEGTQRLTRALEALSGGE